MRRNIPLMQHASGVKPGALFSSQGTAAACCQREFAKADAAASPRQKKPAGLLRHEKGFGRKLARRFRLFPEEKEETK